MRWNAPAIVPVDSGFRVGAGVSGSAKDYLVCPHCDAVQRSITLHRHEVAVCATCGSTVARHQPLSIDQLLALTVAAAVLFLMTNLYPLITVDVDGMHTQATVLGAALSMLQSWEAWPGVVLALSMFILPMIQITVLLWLLALRAWVDRHPVFAQR